ncbi:MAG: hypothetical protein PWQ08_281 [Clostridiales bacterium]|nr:hypothetical protein [Clostridiales bacterium]
MHDFYFGIDHILLVTDFNQPDLHKHWAKHIAIGLDGALEFIVGGQKIVSDGIVINSNVTHTICCTSETHFVFSFEEASAIAREVEKKYLCESDYCVLDNHVIDVVKQGFDLHRLDGGKGSYFETYSKMLHGLGLHPNRFTINDERILQVLDYIKMQEEINQNTIHELLGLVHLSQSRLSHLFKEQVGTPLSSYLAMMKLEKAYQYLFLGNSVTDAALMAGFDSASHFAATSKNMIGLSAKSMSQNSNFVIV